MSTQRALRFCIGVLLALFFTQCKTHKQVTSDPSRGGGHVTAFHSSSPGEKKLEDVQKLKNPVKKKIKTPSFKKKLHKTRKIKQTSPLGMISMILGIIALLLIIIGLFFYFIPFGLVAFLLGIAAIITGAISMKFENRALGIVGMVLGGLTVIIFLVALIVYLAVTNQSSYPGPTDASMNCAGSHGGDCEYCCKDCCKCNCDCSC